MYNYIIFCPYFGLLPNYFSLWLNSCSYNKDFKFVVFTNETFLGDLPENVEVRKMEFSDFRKIVQSKFDFTISLENPYKLCDYKPFYGYIFEELLSDCVYWGYCDLDLIFGDLKKYLPITQYDKVSHLGHFCLYRNTKEIREFFKLKSNSALNYKDILSNTMHFGFDEIGDYGVNKILNINNFSIFPFEKSAADISCAREGMVLAIFENNSFYPKKGNRIFTFEEGKIFAYESLNNYIYKEEYSYIHLQKRVMKNILKEEQCNRFLIFPNSFSKYEGVTQETIMGIKKNLLPVKMFRVRWRSFIKRKKRNISIKKIIINKKRSLCNEKI